MTFETATALATIDLSALRHNAQQLARRAGHASLMAVVKADAYGHGAVKVAQTLLSEGVGWLGVATVSEGVSLRQNGIQCPILVMGPMQPQWRHWYTDFNLDATLSSQDVAHHLAASRSSAGVLRVHLKMDTGMGRLGIDPADVRSVVDLLEEAEGVELIGFSTHFAASDADDLASARAQILRFDRALKEVSTRGRFVHAANTEAICRLPEAFAHHPLALVRAGVGLYGSTVRGDTLQALGLRQVMTLSAKVTQLRTVPAGTPISYGGRWVAPKETRIATLGIGYADGYCRILEGKGWAGLGGARCNIVGVICMDMIMAALEPLAMNVGLGSEAVLFGTGGPHISEVARWANTIPYEIWTGIGMRVPRVYIDSDRTLV